MGDDLVMRRATSDDVAAIVELLADDVLGGGRETAGPVLDPAYVAAFAAITADPNQLLAVAERDGVVVGTLQISFLPGMSHRGAWRGEIEAVRIARGLRGIGLGRTMLRWAIQTCRSRGCRMVQLTTNASRLEAQRFYETLGFIRTHVGFKLALDPQAHST